MKNIKISEPPLVDSDSVYLSQMLKTGWLVEGPQNKAFCSNLSEFTQVPYATTVSSCTSGLYLSLKCLGISKGDAVLVPAFTFPATANAVVHCGAEVIFYDVDKSTYCGTTDQIKNAFEDNNDQNIKALIYVHEFGYPGEAKTLADFCTSKSLHFIEDAACALGTISNEYHVGKYSDAAVFSFHPRKLITAGEGGAVISTSEKLIADINIQKNHGITDVDGTKDFISGSLNFRLTDIQACLLNLQMGRIRDILSIKKDIASQYLEKLGSINGLSLPRDDEGHAWQSFMVVFDNQYQRDLVRSHLSKNNIESNYGANAVHQTKFFQDQSIKVPLPNSEALFQNGLALPIHHKLEESDIENIVVKIYEALN